MPGGRFEPATLRLLYDYAALPLSVQWVENVSVN